MYILVLEYCKNNAKYSEEAQCNGCLLAKFKHSTLPSGVLMPSLASEPNLKDDPVPEYIKTTKKM